MRYQNKSELPAAIQGVLPSGAQELYLQAYNQAWNEYQEGQGYLSREGVAHQRGWTAVRHEYVQDQAGGVWHRVGEVPVDPQGSQGFLGRLRGLFSRKG